LKKIGNALVIGLVLSIILVGVHSVGQAAVMNDLIWVPTANIINNQAAVSGELVGDVGRFEGVYKVDPRVEIGGELISYKGEGYDLGLLAKILFSEETVNQPALAVGLKNKDLYATASKSMGYGMSGHLGIGDGSFGGLFVGISKVINPVSVEITQDKQDKSISATSNFPTTNLMIEYINREINFGARVNLKKSFYLDLAVLDLDQFKLGLNYGF
jgi:hypothetical protein